MSWTWEQEREPANRRAKIVQELDRRTFWKECFLTSLKGGFCDEIAINSASECADNCLKLFESKFPPLVS